MSKITTIYKTRVDRKNPVALSWLKIFRKYFPHIQDVNIENVLRLEGNISEDDINKMIRVFCYPGAEVDTRSTVLKENQGPILEISYQRAWTDPELSSIEHAAQAMQVTGLEWPRLATRFQFVGLDTTEADEAARRFLFDEKSQVFIQPGENWDSLKPQGERGEQLRLNVANMPFQEFKELSNNWRLFLPDEQIPAISAFYRKIARDATRCEIEHIAGDWCDHCSHTTYQALGLLQALQNATKAVSHPLMVSAYVDNSGAMKFYGGWCQNMKGETHISPFNVGPFGGILTLHGGVIRDPMGSGRGAWPFLSTAIFATCDPRQPWHNRADIIHPQILVREAIRATRLYTNPMGLIMGDAKFLIHPNNAKAFSLGHCVGLIPTKHAKKQMPHVGDELFLIGGKTGLDGVHGVGTASAPASHETIEKDGAHVQIGMPIEQRTFMEVIPVLRDRGCIRFITDLGGGGLSSGGGESGREVRKGDEVVSGVWVNLAWVPLKCEGMDDWEIWISESQERMIFAVPPEKRDEALEILDDYGVPASIIGMYTDSEHLQLVYEPLIDKNKWLDNPVAYMPDDFAANLPYSFLRGDCPLPNIEVRAPQVEPRLFSPPIPADRFAWKKLLQRHFGHYNISDQGGADHQFDQTVQGMTKYSYIGGQKENIRTELTLQTPILDKRWASGSANAISQFYGDVNPRDQGKLVYIHAVTRLIAAGFSPGDICCNANVYTPRVTDKPENAWRLSELVHGYADTSRAISVPVLSGKDSSSGTREEADGTRIDAPLTLDVLALGRMPFYTRYVPKPFLRENDQLILFYPGLKEMNLGGSILLDLYGERGDKLPQVELNKYWQGMWAYHSFLQRVRWNRGVSSRSTVGMGGLVRRLFEMSLDGMGCHINLPGNSMNWLFSEMSGAILFATSSKLWLEYLDPDYCLELGRVTSEPFLHVYENGNLLFRAAIEDLEVEWKKTFKEVIS